MSTSFRVVMMGDGSREKVAFNEDTLNNIFSSIKKLSPQPELVFFLGDMVYGGSKVAEQLEKWKNTVKKYYPLDMIFPLLGNHENNEKVFSNAFDYLPKEMLKGYDRTVYYIDYENCRFIVLNSNRMGSSGDYIIKFEQRIWLENVLEASRKKFNFVLFHVPAFPIGQHYEESLDSNPKEREAFWNILDEYEVPAVFVGHEHNYCRRIIDASLISRTNLLVKNPIYHITSGGAGSSMNSSRKDTNIIDVGPLSIYHYIVLDIKDNEVILQALDKDNNLIDSCIIFPKNDDGFNSLPAEVLIPACAMWKYLDNGSDGGTTEWKDTNYDDSSWSSGPAELGYGDGGEATKVSYGPNVHKKYITTYFRKHFKINDPELYKSLTISIQRDDGAVVYLNGEEVFRTNMPSGVIKYNTLASRAVDGSEEVSYENTTIDASNLKAGDNVIAVEIHQASASSSDISFNFQLIGHKV